MVTNDELVNRAIAAHYRASSHEHAIYEQPAFDSSDVEELNGKQYVVLRNVNGILRVYRVRPSDGVLRAMKRWPKELGD